MRQRTSGSAPFASEPPGRTGSTAAAFLTARNLRLASGLVLGAFILCHFSNHALGLVSLGTMEAARPWLSGTWRSPPGTVLLYGAVAVHFVLALRTLYFRRTLRMSAKEAGQTALGLLLPFLIVGHVASTRIDFAFSGVERTYPQLVESFWIRNPGVGARQALALIIAWLHFCLGVYFWQRVKPHYERYRHWLFAAAIVFPVLSLLGFASAGKEIALRQQPVPPAEGGAPSWVAPLLDVAIVAPVLLVFVARGARTMRSRRHRVRIGYPGGRFVEVERGFSVLEASRSGGVPHQAICGGKARCSTCRIEILRGARGQPVPGEAERATLQRIGAGPRVRLACQFRPVRNIEVAPLVVPTAKPGLLLRGGAAFFGEEREIVVLFCDLRDFTRLAEHRLPYDVVFLLNRYFELVGRAVAENGGRIDKFVGDGAMALFGLASPVATAAAQALATAERILADLGRMNETLDRELRETVRVAIAIHQGPAIVGEIGYGEAAGLTAVGDTINVASRLEGLAKEADAELIVSDTAMRSAGLTTGGFVSDTLPVRGRSHPMEVWLRRAGES